MTPHNEAKKEDIAKIVLMSGDPLRIKYIAENYLDDVKLVNSVRGNYAYTGFYKGVRLTVMAHGMGMPSIGIYSYELFHLYDVDTIIRMGSCGALSEELKLLDIILVDNSYTEGNYAKTFDSNDIHLIDSCNELNNIIEGTANELQIEYRKSNCVCCDCFDSYIYDFDKYLKRLPTELNLLACEMESFALFYNAKKEGKKAACLLTVVDTLNDKKVISSHDRETALNNMIKLALESAIKI